MTLSPSLCLNMVLQKAATLFFKYEFDKFIEKKKSDLKKIKKMK